VFEKSSGKAAVHNLQIQFVQSFNKYNHEQNVVSMLVIGSYLLISARLASEAVMVALVDAAKRTDFIFDFFIS